jgi:hypothetical protein
MRIRVAALAVLISALGACNQSDARKEAEQAPSAQESASTRPMLGVYPDRFQCETIVSLADLGAALGGTATVNDSAGAPPPKNVAKGCNYRVAIGAGDAVVSEEWGFDFDCRPDYQKRVDLLFAQYTQQSADLVAAYNAQYGSKPPPPNDAGVVQRAPTDAVEVDVGRRGLDHHGQGILFIDDDAPCYVRVVGPGADRRLMIAKLVAERLHESNAPMTPHLGPK